MNQPTSGDPHQSWEHLYSAKDTFVPPEVPRGAPRWPLYSLIGAVVILLLAIYCYFAFFYKPPTPSADLQFTPSSGLYSGQAFDVVLSASNLSKDALANVRVSILVPEGLSFVGESPSQRFLELPLDNLAAGETRQVSSTLIASGSTQSIKHIKATLTYSTARNPNAEFQKTAEEDLTIGQPAIGLTIETPKQIFNSQNFTTVIRYQNNSTNDYRDVQLKMEYPPAFVAAQGSTTAQWPIGDLPPGGSGSVQFDGALTGQEGSFYNFAAVLNGSLGGQLYPLNSQQAAITITPAPLALTLTADTHSGNDAARTGGMVYYTLTYKNNSTVPFQNLIIRAVLSGEMFNFYRVQTDSGFDSIHNTFTWNVANTPDLATLSPGESHSVTLAVGVLQDFPIKTALDKNYLLNASATIESLTVPGGTAADKTTATAESRVKVGGDMTAETHAYWRDAASKIADSGPYPMKVNTPTQFTVHWLVNNVGTDMKNVTFSGGFRSRTKFTGVVKSNMSTKPEYNNATGQISWTIPLLPANTGKVGAPAEAIFQIETTPALNEQGGTITLFSGTHITAEDAFTGQQFNLQTNEVRSDIPDDKTIPEGSSKLIQP